MNDLILMPPPEKEHFERQLQEIYTHGDNDFLARILNISAGRVSRELNPYVEDKSAFYRAVWWQYATDALSREKGDRLFALFKRDYDSRRANMTLQTSAMTKGAATSEIGIAFANFAGAAEAQMSPDRKIHLLDELIHAAERKRNSILSERR